MRKMHFNSGFFLPKPRISFRFRAWAFMYTTPAAINSTSFIREWFTMCRNVPRVANTRYSVSPSIPGKPSIPIPTRMNPIWDIEEQASVLFKSTENTASRAPPSMVTTPSASISPLHFPSPGNRQQLRIRIP
jgi:hypothetical protein